jgi:hypothetical protein
MATTHQLSLPEHLIGQRNSPLRGRWRSNAPPLPDWKPFYYLLEDAPFEVMLVNARHASPVVTSTPGSILTKPNNAP